MTTPAYSLPQLPNRPTLTHCAICAHPLTDAASIEIGIGPVCRERVNYEGIPEALRRAANDLIVAVALNLNDIPAVRAAAVTLTGMGLARLAGCLLDRFATIFVEATPTDLHFRTPWLGEFQHTIRAAGARWGRGIRMRGRNGAWSMPVSKGHAIALFAALVGSFPNAVVKVSGQTVPIILPDHVLDGETLPDLTPDPDDVSAADLDAMKKAFPDTWSSILLRAPENVRLAQLERARAHYARDMQIEIPNEAPMIEAAAVEPAPVQAAPAVKGSRSDAAKKAWATIRARKAAAAGAAS
jgi:hypothetical protein